MRIKIRNKYIENNLSPSLIAEISCNHCGNKKLFLKHILMAKRSGADFVKIQTYEPEDMTIKSNDRKFKVEKGSFKGKYLWDIYKKACRDIFKNISFYLSKGTLRKQLDGPIKQMGFKRLN